MLIAIQHDVRKVQSNRCGYVWNRMCGDTGISGQLMSKIQKRAHVRQNHHTLFEMQTLDFLHKQLVALIDILCQRHIKCPYKIRMQQAVAYLCYAGCRIAMSKNI